MVELDKIRLEYLEEQFRSYPEIPAKIAKALGVKNLDYLLRENQVNLNLDELNKENKGYLYYSKLYSDVGQAYLMLNKELQNLVDVYFWGEFSDIDWPEIATRIKCSKTGVLKRRYKILEALAIQQGIIF